MLDPFVGIGHSALAAQFCGVNKFIGFDIDSDYIEVAREAIIRGRPHATATMLKSLSQSYRDDQQSLF
jgi:predicted RNA methylase